MIVLPKQIKIYMYETLGGSTGGDCWGGQTHSFHEMSLETAVLGELKREIPDELSRSSIDFEKLTSIFIEMFNIDTKESSSDWYGNYSIYLDETIEMTNLELIVLCLKSTKKRKK